MERLLKKGYEVLYLTEPVDEYCIQSLPEFEQKKFQNVAKEGLKIDQSEKAKEYKEQLEKDFEPFTKWLKTEALKEKVHTENLLLITHIWWLYWLDFKCRQGYELYIHASHNISGFRRRNYEGIVNLWKYFGYVFF